MKQILRSDWHASRIFRVVTGTAAIIYAVIKYDSIMGVAGAMLLLMGLTNTGCGGARGCGIPTKHKAEEPVSKIQYEEVK